MKTVGLVQVVHLLMCFHLHLLLEMFQQWYQYLTVAGFTGLVPRDHDFLPQN